MIFSEDTQGALGQFDIACEDNAADAAKRLSRLLFYPA
jgi:hypothetical protein